MWWSFVILILVVLSLLILALVPFIAYWIGVAWYILYPITIALDVVFLWAIFSVDKLRFAPQRIRKAQWEQTFTREQINLALADYLQQWEDGDHSLDTMLGLAHSYLLAGKGAEAEQFARFAGAELDVVDPADYPHLPWDTLQDDVILVWANGLMYQGRFDDALQIIDDHQPSPKRISQYQAFTAFLAFLAGDMNRARELLSSELPDEADPAFSISANLWYMVLYMRYKLLGEDTLAQLRATDDLVGVWNYTLSKNHDNLYGARLLTILDDIYDLLPHPWVKKTLQRLYLLKHGDTMIAEYQAMRDQGDTSYETAFILSAAYAYHGYGDKAEPLAREALDGIRADGWFERHDDDAHYLTDMIYALVYDALLMQGRFAEAAEQFSQHEPRPEVLNIHRVDLALAYYLAGDDDEARATLSLIRPRSETAYEKWPKKTQLWDAYLLYRLLMTDSRERIVKLQLTLDDWDDDIARLIDNPYRRALQTMVADIRAITGVSADSPSP